MATKKRPTKVKAPAKKKPALKKLEEDIRRAKKTARGPGPSRAKKRARGLARAVPRPKAPPPAKQAVARDIARRARPASNPALVAAIVPAVVYSDARAFRLHLAALPEPVAGGSPERAVVGAFLCGEENSKAGTPTVALLDDPATCAPCLEAFRSRAAGTRVQAVLVRLAPPPAGA